MPGRRLAVSTPEELRTSAGPPRAPTVTREGLVRSIWTTESRRGRSDAQRGGFDDMTGAIPDGTGALLQHRAVAIDANSRIGRKRNLSAGELDDRARGVGFHQGAFEDRAIATNGRTVNAELSSWI